MAKLNRWQKEMNRIATGADAKTEKRLKSIFEKTSKELEFQMTDLLKGDKVKFWQLFRASTLQDMQGQVSSLLYNNYQDVLDEGLSYLQLKQQLGWDEVFYQSSQQLNVDFNRIDLNQAYSLASFSEEELADRLSENLYKDTPQLAERIVNRLDTTLLTGTSSQKIAKELMKDVHDVLQKELNTEYNKAIRIVRTENTRISGVAKQNSMEHVESLGIEAKKMWVASLDNRTRGTHQHLDGQVVGIDEEFVSQSGSTSLAPSNFGVPHEDINCRCKIVTLVEDYKPTTRRAVVYDGEGNKTGTKLVPYTNYKEWEKANEIEA